VIAVEFAILASTAVSYVFERERESYSRLKDDLFEIVDRSTDLVGMTRGGKIVYHNPAFTALTGRDPNQAALRPPDFYPAWAARKLLEEAIPTAISTGSWTGETSLLDREGREVPVLQSIQVFSSQNGKMIDGATIIKNLTQLKADQQQLVIAKEQAEAALIFKSHFLANMSHEIRTPLNGMLGMAQLLADEPLTDQGRQRLDVLLSSGDHLLTLINDILDLAKLEAGKLTLEAAHFRPRDTIASAANLFSSQASQKGIELSFEVEDAELGVVGDEARYRQVLYNLVSNAIKFTEKGSVHVSFSSHSDSGIAHMTTCVRDTGIGIAYDKQRTIFEAFEQEDSSTARRFGGTGLGLSISAKLVELFSGQITVESKPGEGSAFRFSFAAPLSNEAKDRRILTPDYLDKLKILKVIVAEDNRVNQLVIGGLLKRFGIVPTLVGNGVELLDRLATSHFDVILMDCHMPEMDGFEATERILSMEVERPYIIALTASALAEDRERCMRSGMDEFLAKPVHHIDLAQALGRAEQKLGPPKRFEQESAHACPPLPPEVPGWAAALIDCLPEASKC
jgi:two-component system, sensor histidine kinase